MEDIAARDIPAAINRFVPALLPSPPVGYTLDTLVPLLVAGARSQNISPHLDEFAALLFKLKHYEHAQSLLKALPHSDERTTALALLHQEIQGITLTNQGHQNSAAAYLKRYRISAKHLLRRERRFPELINISITENCFLRCKMCFKWKNNFAREDHLAHERWLSFIDELPEDEGVTINFAGAEPLSYPKLHDLIARASKRGIGTSICSNGYLLDSQRIDRLCDAGLGMAALSLDSTDEAIHDGIRGFPGSYKHILEALDYLAAMPASKRPFLVDLQPTIMAANVHTLLALQDFAEERPHIQGVNYLALIAPHNAKASETWQFAEFSELWPKRDSGVAEVLSELMRRRKAGKKISNHLSQLAVFRGYYQDPARFVKHLRGCPLGNAFLNINFDGTVELCPFMEGHQHVGDLKKQALEDIFAGRAAQSMHKKMAGCERNCHLILNCSYEKEQTRSLLMQA